MNKARTFRFTEGVTVHWYVVSWLPVELSWGPKKTGCWDVFIGDDETTRLYGDYFFIVNHYEDPY